MVGVSRPKASNNGKKNSKTYIPWLGCDKAWNVNYRDFPWLVDYSSADPTLLAHPSHARVTGVCLDTLSPVALWVLYQQQQRQHNNNSEKREESDEYYSSKGIIHVVVGCLLSGNEKKKKTTVHFSSPSALLFVIKLSRLTEQVLYANNSTLCL